MSTSEERLQQSYIRMIKTHGLRNIGDCEIVLGSAEEKPRHLLITGDNGVGKTTFVKELYSVLMDKDGGKPLGMVGYYVREDKLNNASELYKGTNIPGLIRIIKSFCEDHTVVPDNAEHLDYYISVADGDFLVFYFGAKREEKFITPDGPKRISQKEHGNLFLQMLVNLKTRSAFANADNDREEVERIEKWFHQLNEALAGLLGHNDFKLEFNRVDFSFKIHEKGKEPYLFTQLSDGYSAIITIISEIMLSMGTDALLAYDKPGIAIVDEIETHLHVELQKKVLPFLTRMFPNLQFVVTTHSPFVLSSIENSVIYDLGTHRKFEDFSNYSYSNIIEGYFDVSGYSDFILTKLDKFTRIFEKEILSDADRKEIAAFDEEIKKLPGCFPLELKNRWLNLKLRNIKKLA